MEVTVYTKTGCKLCRAAKEKLLRMGVAFEERDLARFLDAEWEKLRDSSLKAFHAYIDERVPMIVIDGWPYDYPGAMKKLKELIH